MNVSLVIRSRSLVEDTFNSRGGSDPVGNVNGGASSNNSVSANQNVEFSSRSLSIRGSRSVLPVSSVGDDPDSSISRIDHEQGIYSHPIISLSVC